MNAQLVALFFAYPSVPLATYAKAHQTPAQIVAHLTQKGLNVPDPVRAEAAIRSFGYERLRIYMLARRDSSQAGKPFHQNTTFDHILGLYRLDEELRTVAFQGCGKFEILFRNQMSEVLTSQHGCHPFMSSIFKDDDSAVQTLKILNEAYFNRISQDRRAKHYFETYSNPSVPPMWRMKEFFTFEKALRMYGCLKDDIKVEVSKKMGINLAKHDVFLSWAKAIIDLRNACAHHDRIFNRKFQKQPAAYRNGHVFSKGKREHVSGLLECIDFVCNHFGEDCTHFDRAKHIVINSVAVRPSEVGF